MLRGSNTRELKPLVQCKREIVRPSPKSILTGQESKWGPYPDSLQDDAWGVTWAPIAVVANSAGTAVTIQGGNHGDEYESPIPSHKGASVKPPAFTCKSPPLAIKHIA